MKKFIFKTILFLTLLLTSFIVIIAQADGYTDPLYLKFTTPKQQHLILGSSRALQGLKPDVIEKETGIQFYNYAFSIMVSPFGKTYLNSIKNKIKKGKNKGIFILTVDPWVLASQTENPNDSLSFRELNLCLGNTLVVDVKPNFTYLLNNLKGEYYTVFTRKYTEAFLHDDGWLEVSIDMDSIANEQRVDSKYEFYKDVMLPKMKYSTLRYEYLKKTIDLLNEYGDVYLVRLPVHPKIMELDTKLIPNFNTLIEDLKPFAKGYLDLTSRNKEFKYNDGNHLYKTDATKVSIIVANWINTKSK